MYPTEHSQIIKLRYESNVKGGEPKTSLGPFNISD